MRIAILGGIIAFLVMGVYFALVLVALSFVISDTINPAVFGLYFRPSALLIMVLVGVVVGRLSYEKENKGE